MKATTTTATRAVIATTTAATNDQIFYGSRSWAGEERTRSSKEVNFFTRNRGDCATRAILNNNTSRAVWNIAIGASARV